MSNELKLIIPLDGEELIKYLNHFSDYSVVIDVKKSIKKFNGSVDKFLNYIFNCRIYDPYLQNFEYDEQLEELMLAYIKYDEELYIPLLSQLWLELLHPQEYDFVDKNRQTFLNNFEKKHQDYLQELADFLYSMNYSLVCEIGQDYMENDYNTDITNAEENSLKLCGVNIVSLANEPDFYPYVKSLRATLYHYREFYTNVLHGGSITAYFLENDTPYRYAALMVEIINHPEEMEKELEREYGSEDTVRDSD